MHESEDDLDRWLRLGTTRPTPIVRLVLVDVDGVLTQGEGAPADPGLLQRLASLNATALEDRCVPGVALCTGRQAPYVELLAQLTGSFLPCLFEHGAGMFEPQRFRFAFNPSLGPHPWRDLASVRAALDEPLLSSGRAFVQPGKEATMTLYPLGSTSVAQLAELAADILARAGNSFRVTPNVHGVEIRPPGIDKGAGTRWLSSRLQIPVASFGGVGDADDDLTFLRLVGFPSAPANATSAVRSASRYVATARFGEGLLQILEHIVALNRAATPVAG
jgi:hydroxymethylpyrimidine pyrophosphatase-like HAD family hydrolase